ncbi:MULTISPECIES: GntR family transcriptional regulator [Micrococcaceae]|uniref:GntR family transcriptional regulator n=1 Tax=Micrococcaceae TaxID=1268 RepID=UPI001959201B|nr:GntR family transcriptional regulator [Glutamicibacter protophormiae]QRQ78457.1 GntR family transcriptional regulator [Glutamicibacter protophormiae]
MAKASENSISGIREAILDGVWAPGARLAPPELAKMFSTSTTVIRESLTRLAGEGLAESIPNRGFFVAQLNLRQLRDMTELRCVTEALAASLAVQRGDVNWESKLIAVHHKLSKTPRRSPESPQQFSTEWGRVHREFHQLLLAPCDCPPMLALSSNLANSTLLYRRWAAPSSAASSRNVEAEHQALLDAALARDGELLGRLLRTHYESSVQVILDAGLFDAETAPTSSGTTTGTAAS